ncbi:Uncharacterised protein [Mycobacteroides abscessus subsp. bolletii]|nr:Uncharacterised protein [Mycobacteroides abscessus]SKE35359.1 Uncharacterised protein [Mycobacteroides abscessus subsp. bolletii]SKG47509.1 Uncharacterised protein [Mycobacteroides abscessus subsp. bolletii]
MIPVIVKATTLLQSNPLAEVGETPRQVTFHSDKELMMHQRREPPGQLVIQSVSRKCVEIPMPTPDLSTAPAEPDRATQPS